MFFMTDDSEFHSQEMINSYRGIIAVDSAGGEDQIHVVLPGCVCPEQGAGVKCGQPIPRNLERILFVDDESTIANLF